MASSKAYVAEMAQAKRDYLRASNVVPQLDIIPSMLNCEVLYAYGASVGRVGPSVFQHAATYHELIGKLKERANTGDQVYSFKLIPSHEKYDDRCGMEGRVPSQWPRHKLLDVYLKACTKVTEAEYKAMTTFADQLKILRSFPGWAQFYRTGVLDSTARKSMSALLTFLFLGVEPSLVRSGSNIKFLRWFMFMCLGTVHASGRSVQVAQLSAAELRTAFVTYKVEVIKHFKNIVNCYDDRNRHISWWDAVPTRFKTGVPAVFIVPAQFIQEGVFLKKVAAIDTMAIDEVLMSSDDDKDKEEEHAAIMDEGGDDGGDSDGGDSQEAGPSRSAKRSRRA